MKKISLKLYFLLLIAIVAIFLNCNLTLAESKVLSGQAFDVFKIGDSIIDFQNKIKQSSYNNWSFKHNKLDRWNYVLTSKEDPNLSISFCFDNNILKAILIHEGYSECKNQKYPSFNVDNKEVTLNKTTETKLKQLFPTNEPYSYGVLGLLDIKKGLDFHLYDDQCNPANKDVIVKSIIIFEKNNTFLFDSGEEGI
ncbi:MAG: hypothetical protein AB1782_16745 [Cyanobacteriota bacterium]